MDAKISSRYLQGIPAGAYPCDSHIATPEHSTQLVAYSLTRHARSWDGGSGSALEILEIVGEVPYYHRQINESGHTLHSGPCPIISANDAYHVERGSYSKAL